MSENAQQIEDLVIKQLNGRLTAVEEDALQQWFAASEENMGLLNKLNDQGFVREQLNYLEALNEKQAFTEISQQLSFPPTFSIKPYWRWSAAAILIIAISLGVYYFSNQSSTSNAIKGGTGETRGTKEDVAPGTNRAILTINNNLNIDLATNKTGININNTITYNDGEKIADAGQMLQLTTPRGGQYQAVLPDGSKVWLNAASSIKFPSKFNSKERRVEVIGEAYFEITKDATRSFKVYGGGQDIEVLGTSFNVNVYDDEPDSRIALFSGSVKIGHIVLKPGQSLEKNNIVNNTGNELAWKDGVFLFTNNNVQTIMRQLARWYNVDIIYNTNNIPWEFNGRISRHEPLSQVLQLLELTGKIKFEIKGNQLIVDQP